MQYTHARLCSILRKYGKDVTTDIDYPLLNEDDAIHLIKNLWQYPFVVLKAAQFYEPSLVSNYLIDICAGVNKFYNAHRVLSEDEGLTKARILLVDAARQIIKNGLKILGTQAPVEM